MLIDWDIHTNVKHLAADEFGDMEVRQLPTYGVKEKRTEITK